MMDTHQGLGDLAGRAAGCPAALEALLGELVGPVRDFHLGWLRSRRDGRDAAQDLAQETLLRIMRGIGECRARTDRQVMAWALTVARHVALDHSKAERRRRARYFTSPEPEELAAGPSASSWASERMGCDPRNSELMSILAAHLSVASESVQEILWIRFVEGGTWSDVAGEMKMTLRAVQRRFQRFEEALRADDRRSDDPFPDHRFPP